MAEDKHDANEQARRCQPTGCAGRRLCCGGGGECFAGSSRVSIRNPGIQNPETPPGSVNTLGATYNIGNPVYTSTFIDRYGAHVDRTHNTILTQFPDKTKMWWGNYQKIVANNPVDWGSPSAFNDWPDYVDEVRNDLQKQPRLTW